MQQPKDFRLASLSELHEQTQLLAAIEPSEAGFVSCYLDAQLGRDGCRRFLVQQAAALRATLSGADLLDFEEALALIQRRLDDGWHPQAKGLALFARGLAGGRYVSDMQFGVPLPNRLTFYRIPEIAPLLSLAQIEHGLGLVVVRRGAIQVFDVEMGSVSLRAWVAAPDASFGAATGPSHKPAANRIRLLRRVLAAGGAGPLILAGDRHQLEPVRDWLPQRAAARLVDMVAVPFGLGQSDAIDFVCRRAALKEDGAGCLTGRWIRAIRQRRDAVAGCLASLQALRQGQAGLLVMTPEYQSPPGWRCEDCGATELAVQAPTGCATCGAADKRPWNVRIELARLAVQMGVPLHLSDSDELRYLGGVGCLLKPRPQVQESRTALPGRRLDLVA